MKKFFHIFTLFSVFFFASCATLKTDENYEVPEPRNIKAPPAVLTELPVIDYQGAGIKYEIESMLLHNFLVLYDESASGQYCARLSDESSVAQLKVRFPAGTYECLINEKATDNDHAAFYVYLDGIPYRVYPSDPPLRSWELTTRVPIYFTIDEPRTILIQIQANSKNRLGETGMNLDYIQFVKRN